MIVFLFLLLSVVIGIVSHTTVPTSDEAVNLVKEFQQEYQKTIRGE